MDEELTQVLRYAMQAGLAGLSFDEGTFGVFGWVAHRALSRPCTWLVLAVTRCCYWLRPPPLSMSFDITKSALTFFPTCYRYITKGMDVLTKLQSGDKIISAKVVSGADKLVKP